MTANKESSATDIVDIGVAAKTIGISPSTLRQWEAKGRISSRRQTGGRRVYKTADVLRLAEEHGNPGKIIASSDEERERALDMVNNTYSSAAASVILDVSLETLRRWRDQGRLPACERRLLGQIRYDKALVDSMASSLRADADLTGS